MTLPASVGVRSLSGAPPARASDVIMGTLHQLRVTTGLQGLEVVRRQAMQGTAGRSVLALLVAALADGRCRPLAGRRPTVLKSCLGVASQRGCAPDDGVWGADPAPVWRKC